MMRAIVSDGLPEGGKAPRGGRPQQFYKLLFRRDWPFFYAFDALSIDGEDLRAWPLVERKRRLLAIMTIDSRLLYVDHLWERGSAFFRAACERDLEGIVAKW